MSAPTKPRKRAPAKATGKRTGPPVAPPSPPDHSEEFPPAQAVEPPPQMTAEQRKQARIQELTGIEMEEALSILQQRVGELETQRLMDGRVISKLVTRIQELDPQDPVAADAAARQEAP